MKPPNLIVPLTNLVELFQAGKTPYHLIGLISTFTIVFVCGYNVSTNKWLALLIPLAILLFIIVLIASQRQVILDDLYPRQLRIAKILGISAAAFSFLIAGEEAIDNDQTFWYVFVPAVIQLVIFVCYILFSELFVTDRPNDMPDPGKRRNHLQLSLITASLILGISANSMLWRHQREANELEKLCFTEAIKGAFDKLSRGAAEDKTQELMDLRRCYQNFKGLNESVSDANKNLTKYLRKENRQRLASLERDFTRVTNTDFLEYLVALLKEQEEDASAEYAPSTQAMISVIDNGPAYKKLMKDIKVGYAWADSMNGHIGDLATLMNSCMTSSTDTLIDGLLSAYETRKQLFTETEACYAEFLSQKRTFPDNIDLRREVTNIVHLALWLVCIIVWLIEMLPLWPRIKFVMEKRGPSPGEEER